MQHTAFGYLLTVQQLGPHMHVGNRSRRRADGMHDALLGIHADVHLHPEIPLISFLRLMHFGITILVLVLGRGSRVNNRRIHYRARGDTDAPAPQVQGSPRPACGRTVRTLPANGGSSRSWSRPEPQPGPDLCRQSGACPAAS